MNNDYMNNNSGNEQTNENRTSLFEQYTDELAAQTKRSALTEQAAVESQSDYSSEQDSVQSVTADAPAAEQDKQNEAANTAPVPTQPYTPPAQPEYSQPVYGSQPANNPQPTYGGNQSGAQYNRYSAYTAQQTNSSYSTYGQQTQYSQQAQYGQGGGRYAPPVQPRYTQPVYTHQFTAQQPEKPKKVKKPLGRGAVAATIIICLIVSIFGGFIGSYAGDRFFGVANSDYTSSSNGSSTTLFESVERDSLSDGSSQTSNISKVAAFASPSVVEIETEQIVSGTFISQYVASGAGSGVIVSIDGYIVTCRHVVNGANNIKVRTYDGKEYTATLVGSDSKTDLAVIKIDETDLQAAVFGTSSDLIAGESCVAIGNPLGSLGGTVTEGIISAVSRELVVNSQTMTLLQTTAAVNPGNSGGGLFNTEGELIGIVNAKSSGDDIEGIGFAIPSDIAKDVVSNIIENGYVTGRPALGIQAIEITDILQAQQNGVNRLGVYVYSVVEGSGAEKSGLQRGDYLLEVDGQVISSLSDISSALNNFNVGDTVKVRIIRSEKIYELSIVLSELSE